MSDAKPKRPVFDVLATGALEQTARDLLEVVPEVRSVLCVLDYDSTINTGQPRRGIWMGRSEGGQVLDPAAVFGTLDTVFSVLAQTVYPRAEDVYRALLKQTEDEASRLVQLTQERIQCEQQLERLRAERAALDAAGATGSAAVPPPADAA